MNVDTGLNVGATLSVDNDSFVKLIASCLVIFIGFFIIKKILG